MVSTLPDTPRELNALRDAGAPEADLIEAVKRARDQGWRWSAIARALGSTPAEIVERFSAAIHHPVASRIPRQRGHE